MQTIALIAGNGTYPLVFAKAAKKAGVRIIAVGIKEETDPALEHYVEKIFLDKRRATQKAHRDTSE